MDHPLPLSSHPHVLPDVGTSSTAPESLKTTAPTSTPNDPPRPRRIVPPSLARIINEGDEYSEWGDLTWKLYGKPDGTLDMSKFNESLSQQEIDEAWKRMISRSLSMVVANNSCRTARNCGKDG